MALDQTVLAQLRLLANDTDLTDEYFTDGEYETFYSLARGADPSLAKVKRAAAVVLDAIASNETLVAKKVTDQGYTVDGPAVAADLRKQAAALRTEADVDEESDDVNDGSFFDIIPGRRHDSWWC